MDRWMEKEQVQCRRCEGTMDMMRWIEKDGKLFIEHQRPETIPNCR